MKVLKSAKTKQGNKVELFGNQNHSKALVIGVFHGDEPQGKFLIEEFININPQSELLFIPCLNPDGLMTNKRVNASGVDLNRNFPTKNWELSEKNEFFGGEISASEIETKFLIEIIEQYKPETILTLHAPFKVVNYDGDASELAEEISNIIDYPVQKDIGYATAGSFGTYAGVERGIKTITLELDEISPVQELISPVFKIFDII